MTSSFFLFFAEGLTILALLSSIRGWWPALFVGVLHFLCLVFPWVRRVTNIVGNKLPLLAAECQLVYAVSMELKARRHDETLEIVTATIRAGLVSAAFWILVFFFSEMAFEAAVGDEKEKGSAESESVPGKCVPGMTTLMHPLPGSMSSFTYPWIRPSNNTGSPSSQESRGATFSAVCTFHLDSASSTTVPAASLPTALTGSTGDHASHPARVTASIVTPAMSSDDGLSSPDLSSVAPHSTQNESSPRCFILDNGIPSFVATSEAASGTTAEGDRITEVTNARHLSEKESMLQTMGTRGEVEDQDDADGRPIGSDSVALDDASNSRRQEDETSAEVAQSPPQFASQLLSNIFTSTTTTKRSPLDRKTPSTSTEEAATIQMEETTGNESPSLTRLSSKKHLLAWAQPQVTKKMRRDEDNKWDATSAEESSQRRAWYKRRREWL